MCSRTHPPTHAYTQTRTYTCTFPYPEGLVLKALSACHKNARRHGFSAVEGCSFTESNRASSDLVASEKFSIHCSPATTPRASLFSEALRTNRKESHFLLDFRPMKKASSCFVHGIRKLAFFFFDKISATQVLVKIDSGDRVHLCVLFEDNE